MIEIPQGGLRISMGCGRHTVEGWFCIDAQQDPKADRPLDMIADITKPLDLPDACASEVLAVHVWEHFYRWDCDVVIREWHRLLRTGAKLTLEMPDLMKACRNILDGKTTGSYPDQLGLWALYGDPQYKDPLMCHRWAWTFKSLSPYLMEHGFKNCVEEVPQWHKLGRYTRDFRIVAFKR